MYIFYHLDQNISELNCTETIQNMFIAGTDTTSGSLNWTMLIILRHPEVQDKCRKEIMDVSSLHSLYIVSFIASLFHEIWTQ